MPSGFRPELSDTIQKLNEDSQRARDKISAEWMPFELELDKSIAAMHDLRSN
jgi:hypothetical protein